MEGQAQILPAQNLPAKVVQFLLGLLALGLVHPQAAPQDLRLFLESWQQDRRARLQQGSQPVEARRDLCIRRLSNQRFTEQRLPAQAAIQGRHRDIGALG